MKTITISSLFVFSVLAVGMVAMPPAAFADHGEVTVVPAEGSSVPGCEETDAGCYTPMVATVDVGGKVIFSNTDVVAHVFAAGTIDDGLSGEFDSSLVLPGASFEWTATEVGTVEHFCYVHPWMSGTIIVQEAGAAMDDKMMDDKMMDDRHMTDKPSVYYMLSDGTVIKVWASVPTEGEMMEIKVKFANYGDDAMMEDKMMEDKMMEDKMMEDKMMEDKMMEDDAMMEDKMMEDDAMMEDKMMDDKHMDDKHMDDKHMDGKSGGVEHVNYDVIVTQNDVEVLRDEGVHDHDGVLTHTTAALASADPVEIQVIFNGFGIPGEELTGPIGEEAAFTNVVPEFGTIAMMVLAVAIISIVAVTAKSRVVPKL